MKKIIFTIAALLLSSTSHAVVADRFKCALEVNDSASNAFAKENKVFFIARLPASVGQDIRLTMSQTWESLTLETPKAEFGVNLNFYYKHAVKMDPNGNPLEARQLTCLALSGSYCEKSVGDGNSHACVSDVVTSCKEPQNPFDPNNGWSPTGLVNGIPTFNEQTLGSAVTRISDRNGNIVGIVTLNCQYLGSFQ